MPVTLEQARALDALARHGTFEGAALALHKGHTAVVYALRTMEEQLGVVLLDRRGYRTKVTPAGERILGEARKLLAAERELEAACAELRTGWEPRVRIVFDGIFPTDAILRVVRELVEARSKTRIDVSTAFLGGVEAAFVASDADMMISVMPAATPGLRGTKLAPIRAMLLAHKMHPLIRRKEKTPIRREDLAAEVLLTVRGSDPRLELSTAGIEPSFSVELNDFQAKKAAILSKMGFGWLPEHLVTSERESGILQEVHWRGASVHHFEPRLYHRDGRRLGRAGQLFVKRLSELA